MTITGVGVGLMKIISGDFKFAWPLFTCPSSSSSLGVVMFNYVACYVYMQL